MKENFQWKKAFVQICVTEHLYINCTLSDSLMLVQDLIRKEFKTKNHGKGKILEIEELITRGIFSKM